VARRYLRGLAQAEDCTFESMAAVVEGGCAQQFQHFISESPWDHEPVVAQIGRDADAVLGGKETSALIIDESSFPKQGDRSVGVARQWTGRLGKVDNCQVAVFGVLTDDQRHTPVDMRLYLPGVWTDDPVTARNRLFSGRWTTQARRLSPTCIALNEFGPRTRACTSPR
jgi:SRSO17 transposase